jgi:F-type H+-transporting ATPase subunit delta
MLIPRVAKRYAEAVYDAIPADLGMELLLSDLRDIRSSMEQSRELRVFFASPVIPFAKKRQVIEELFASKVQPYTYEMLMFLLKKRREHLLPHIIESVFDLVREHNGVQKAAVRCARPMSEEQQQELSTALAGLTRRSIESSYELDERLLGGIVVRLGDMVYDGSVVRQLQRLRRRFVSGAAA